MFDRSRVGSGNAAGMGPGGEEGRGLGVYRMGGTKGSGLEIQGLQPGIPRV